MEFEEKIQNEIQNLTYQILAIDNENSLTKSYLCGKFDAYNELLLFYYKTHYDMITIPPLRKNVNGEIYGK
jgi:hypothetical protein